MHCYKTISRVYAVLPKEKRLKAFSFFYPLFFIITSMALVQLLEIYKHNTLEMVMLNGLVFSILTAEQIIVTTSKVKNNIKFSLHKLLTTWKLSVIPQYFSFVYS